jgi:hypothetical protein
MTGPFPPGGPVPQGQPQPTNIGADFLIDPNNPAIGMLVLQIGPATFQVGMPTAGIVGFLRSLADNVEKKVQATPNIVRPTPGLFLPNGAGR